MIIFKNINTKDKTPISTVRWNSEISLNGQLEKKNYQGYVQTMFYMTTYSAAQWFQYMIVHGILPVKNI